MAIVSINPATGEKLKEFSPFDDAEIAKRLKLAENASSKYRRTRFIDRSVLFEAVAELLFQEKKKFAEPALMAGNVGLLKHASNVPQCALAIEEIFCRAGFADGVFQTLLIEPEQVEKVIANPRVKAVTLTGSEKAGSAVAGMAAHEIKKSVLELGGSDPFIVMPSADFESALNIAVKARTINTGQSCIAAKRLLIADKIYDEFLEQFVARMRALKLGNPMDPATEIGPL